MKKLMLVVAATLSLVGCVTSGRYRQDMKDVANTAITAINMKDQQIAVYKAEVLKLRADVTAKDGLLKECMDASAWDKEPCPEGDCRE